MRSPYVNTGGGADNAMRASKNVQTKLQSNDGCFVAGTEILTTEGIKNIEDIRAGDWVYSAKLRTGLLRYMIKVI